MEILADAGATPNIRPTDERRHQPAHLAPPPVETKDEMKE